MQKHTDHDNFYLYKNKWIDFTTTWQENREGAKESGRSTSSLFKSFILQNMMVLSLSLIEYLKLSSNNKIVDAQQYIEAVHH